jgi:hypothetical protein
VAIGYDFGALNDADPLQETKASREAINAGIGVIVPIENTVDSCCNATGSAHRARARMQSARRVGGDDGAPALLVAWLAPTIERRIYFQYSFSAASL